MAPFYFKQLMDYLDMGVVVEHWKETAVITLIIVI